MSALLTWLLLGLGGFCALSGALGIFRMPDFYSRLHPASTGDTLGQLLISHRLPLPRDRRAPRGRRPGRSHGSRSGW